VNVEGFAARFLQSSALKIKNPERQLKVTSGFAARFLQSSALKIKNPQKEK